MISAKVVVRNMDVISFVKTVASSNVISCGVVDRLRTL
jgi:hypothetical protein